MKGKFTIVYQRSHDIDWFARKGNMMIHAMSFGGLLPDSVNQWVTNLNMMKKAYRLPMSKIEVVYSDYAERMMREGNGEGGDGDRERYIRHFRDMAQRGFWSFDRDLYDENLYHLIARPTGDFPDEILINDLPELYDVELDADISDREVKDVSFVMNRRLKVNG